EPLSGMDDTDHPLFPRFSAELVATALKDTPVVMVTGPRQCGKTTLVREFGRGQSRIHHHGRRHGAGGGTQRSTWVSAGSIERPLTKFREWPTFSGPSRSQSMMIVGRAGFC